MDHRSTDAAAGTTAPTVTAIIVNYNGLGFVHEAVASLLAQDFAQMEVVVVDNGSTDGSDRDLESRFGGAIRLLHAGRNLGFGAGNNLAIRGGSSGYLVLLNHDAVADRSFVSELVAAAEADPRIGMVAAKVLDYTHRDTLDTAGHLLYPDGLNRGRGRLEADRGQYDHCRTALIPSGAAALYRRAMLDEIGLFDEAFFLYGDDTELGLRGRIAAWECAFAPRAIAFHRYSQTTGPYSLLKAFHTERNRIWVLLKIFPFVLILISPAFTSARLLLKTWAALKGRGAAGRIAREQSLSSLCMVVLSAHASALKGLPPMLRQRWRDRRLRRIGTREFIQLLRSHRLSLREVALKE